MILKRFWYKSPPTISRVARVASGSTDINGGLVPSYVPIYMEGVEQVSIWHSSRVPDSWKPTPWAWRLSPVGTPAYADTSAVTYGDFLQGFRG